jgi:hypothetical protein
MTDAARMAADLSEASRIAESMSVSIDPKNKPVSGGYGNEDAIGSYEQPLGGGYGGDEPVGGGYGSDTAVPDEAVVGLQKQEQDDPYDQMYDDDRYGEQEEPDQQQHKYGQEPPAEQQQQEEQLLNRYSQQYEQQQQQQQKVVSPEVYSTRNVEAAVDEGEARRAQMQKEMQQDAEVERRGRVTPPAGISPQKQYEQQQQQQPPEVYSTRNIEAEADEGDARRAQMMKEMQNDAGSKGRVTPPAAPIVPVAVAVPYELPVAVPEEAALVKGDAGYSFSQRITWHEQFITGP